MFGRCAAVRLGFGLGLLLAAWPSEAYAINGARPRVPPSFYDHACVTVVGPDAPLVEIGLTVPYADVELTEDELSDSRTIQLYAFARDRPPGEALPNWVDEGDVARALEAGILDTAPEADDVLSRSRWSEDTFPLVAVEDRLPITCESAGPWPWETDAVPLGAYVVWGYTFEPPLNLWTPRPGVIRVVDGAGSGPPAVALTGLDRRQEFGREQGLAVTGCLSADPGTEVELSWSRASAPADWTLFARLTSKGDDAAGDEGFEDGVFEDGVFEAVLQPPEDTLYQALHVRAEAIDPQGRRFTHYARGVLVVLETCVEAAVVGAHIDDACGVAPSAAEPARAPLPCEPTPDDVEEEEEEDQSPAPGPATGPEGCAMVREGGAARSLLVLLLLCWWRPRGSASRPLPSAGQ